MKVGVFSFVFQDFLTYDEAPSWIAGIGAEVVEVGSGGYVAELGESYCRPAQLLESEQALKEWQQKAADQGLEISALRLVAYDYVLTMEHEDSLMSLRESLEKEVSLPRDLVLTDPKGQPWFGS